MNRRNIGFVGFTKQEYNSISIIDVRECKEFWSMDDSINHRFPYIHNYSSLEEATNHQGFILFIHDKSHLDIVSFDIKFRHRLHYDFAVFVSDEYKNDYQFNSFSKIGKISSQYLYSEYANSYLEDFYLSQSIKKKIHHKIKSYYSDIIELLKNKKQISTRELTNIFAIQPRTLERDMFIINELNDCIGYDYSTNKWYYV